MQASKRTQASPSGAKRKGCSKASKHKIRTKALYEQGKQPPARLAGQAPSYSTKAIVRTLRQSSTYEFESSVWHGLDGSTPLRSSKIGSARLFTLQRACNTIALCSLSNSPLAILKGRPPAFFRMRTKLGPLVIIASDSDSH